MLLNGVANLIAQLPPTDNIMWGKPTSDSVALQVAMKLCREVVIEARVTYETAMKLSDAVVGRQHLIEQSLR